MSQHAIEVHEGNFEREVVEASHARPVLLDFWAPWCGPCRTLTPVLEELAREFAGRFRLAKVNADENQQLAVQFGVRGIPNVKLLVEGAVVDEFSGALPESAVREFLQRWIPSRADELRRDAMRLHEGGSSQQALELLAQARDVAPDDEHVLLDQVQVLLEVGDLEGAEGALAALPLLAREDDRARNLEARLDFARKAAQGAGDTDELEARVAANGDDLTARLELADALVARGEHEAALAQLLEVVRRDRSFGDDAARKRMLSVFDLLGNGGELVSRYRRLLAAALT